MMIIRKAEKNEYEDVKDFYYTLIDEMEGTQYGPRWVKGIYPSEDDIRGGIEKDEFYVGTENGKIIASVRINHEVNEGYEKGCWKVNSDYSRILILHLLAIGTGYQKRSLGKELVRFAIEKAKNEGMAALRLDVISGNLPANRLYESMGFEPRGTVTLYYEDTGYTDFDLYEYIV